MIMPLAQNFLFFKEVVVKRIRASLMRVRNYYLRRQLETMNVENKKLKDELIRLGGARRLLEIESRFK